MATLGRSEPWRPWTGPLSKGATGFGSGGRSVDGTGTTGVPRAAAAGAKLEALSRSRVREPGRRRAGTAGVGARELGIVASPGWICVIERPIVERPELEKPAPVVLVM